MTGWFGKIPALGDFAVRRLPQVFVERWDAWLCAELHAARAIFGTAWESTWDAAASACFTLAAGVVDANDWHGVLMPSTDRVGRRFPLSILRNGCRCVDVTPAAPYWGALVDAASQVRHPGCGADDLDRALAAVALPEPETADRAPVSDWGIWCHAQSTVIAVQRLDELPRGVQFRRLLTGGAQAAVDK